MKKRKLIREREELIHDLKRQMEISHHVLNEADDLRAALEPLANMADASMNDPLSKWLTVAQIKFAESVYNR
jgi:hypothetical protein